jgi:hypothetical protein
MTSRTPTGSTGLEHKTAESRQSFFFGQSSLVLAPDLGLALGDPRHPHLRPFAMYLDQTRGCAGRIWALAPCGGPPQGPRGCPGLFGKCFFFSFCNGTLPVSAIVAPSHPQLSTLPPRLFGPAYMTLDSALRSCKRFTSSLTQLENVASKNTFFGPKKSQKKI